jgi:hypothetical protein
MPHVDDGTLHALLDGALRAEDPARADVVEAHLDTCPDCRALRDRAAALRADATGILAALEPDARPDFQEVLARAGHGVAAPGTGASETAGAAALPGGRAGRLRGQARATRAMAWAATVVLALGTGYLIRDLVEPDAGFVAIQERSAADAVPVEPQAAGRPEAEAADAVDPGAARPVAPTTVPSTPPATAPAVAPPAVAPTAAAPPPVARAEAETLAAADPDVALEEIVVAAPTMAREPVLTRTAPGRQAAPAVEARRMVEEAADRPAIRLRGATAITGWSAITDADARALMDGPLYVLPGAVVDSLFARGHGFTAEVRSLQRLDGFVLLTVTQRRANGPETAVYGEAMRTQADAPVASALHHQHWITVTGALPAETLQALADSARPLPHEGPTDPPR